MLKPIHNSNISQTTIQHVSGNTNKSLKGISGNTNNVSNNNQKCPVMTSEKTVHKKDISQLTKKITKSIENIMQDIKKASSGAIGANNLFSNSPATMKLTLKTLEKDINKYQDLLKSSSYNHHKSKPEKLEKLKNQLSEANKKVDLTENKTIHKEKMNNIKYHDNLERQNNFINGVKPLSKFNE